MKKKLETTGVEEHESQKVADAIDIFGENVKDAWIEFVERINDVYPYGGEQEAYLLGHNLNRFELSPRLSLVGYFDDVGVNVMQQLPRIKEAIIDEVKKKKGFFQKIRTSIKITPEDIGMVGVIEEGEYSSEMKIVSGMTNIKDDDFTIDLFISSTEELKNSDPRFKVPEELKRIFGIRKGIAKAINAISQIDSGKTYKKAKGAYEKELADKQNAQTRLAEQYLNIF